MYLQQRLVQLHVRLLGVIELQAVTMTARAKILRNQVVPLIGILPPELLAIVLNYAINPNNWPHGGQRNPYAHEYFVVLMKLRLVSRHWQDVIDNNPTFWAHVFVDDSEKLWRLILRMSKGLPLYFGGFQREPGHTRLLELLDTIDGRPLKSFETNFNGDYFTNPAHQLLKTILSQTAAHLTTLDLVSTNQRRFRIRSPLFGGNHPCLRNVTIEGRFHIDWADVKLTGLESLRLRGYDGFVSPTLAEYIGMLGDCPSMRRIELTNMSMPDLPISDDEAAGLRCNLPELEELQLRYISSTTASNLLAVIRSSSAIEATLTLSGMNDEQQIHPTVADRFAAFIVEMTTRALEREGQTTASIEMHASGAGVVIQGNTFLWDDAHWPVPATRDQERTIVTPVFSRIPANDRAGIVAAFIHDDSVRRGPRTHQTAAEGPSPAILMLSHNFPNITAVTLGRLTPAIEPDLREPRYTGEPQGVGFSEWLLPNLHTITARHRHEDECDLGRYLRIVDGRNEGRQTISRITTISLEAPSWSRQVQQRLRPQTDQLQEAGVLITFKSTFEIQDDELEIASDNQEDNTGAAGMGAAEESAVVDDPQVPDQSEDLEGSGSEAEDERAVEQEEALDVDDEESGVEGDAGEGSDVDDAEERQKVIEELFGPTSDTEEAELAEKS